MVKEGEGLLDRACAVCGGVMKVRVWKDRRVVCSEACREVYKRREATRRMREYRATERGKVAMRLQNMRYKRPDIEHICRVCGDKFLSARKNRVACDKEECQRKDKVRRINECRSRQPKDQSFR